MPHLITQNHLRKAKKLINHPYLFWKDAILRPRRTSVFSQYDDPLIAKAENLFHSGKVDNARETLDALRTVSGASLFLSARMDFFASRFLDSKNKCLRAMLNLPRNHPVFKSAFYLSVESRRALGDFEGARHALSHIPFKDASNRFFRNLRLSIDSPDNVDFFYPFIFKYNIYSKGWDKGLYNLSLFLRDFGVYDLSLSYARDRFIGITKSRSWGSAFTASNSNWKREAATALSDLKEDFEAQGIEMFLISGAVLGCVRENNIIGHDKDLDIGVDERYPLDTIRQAILDSPRFRVREIPSRHSVYAQHANGVLVDVFRHYMSDGRYYHEGPKVRWWNTPFELTKVRFLGEDYLIPKDHDTYLTENYGDWRTPVSDFETFVDTPNMEISAENNLIWYYLSKLSDYFIHGKIYQFHRVSEAYFGLSKDVSLRDLISNITPIQRG